MSKSLGQVAFDSFWSGMSETGAKMSATWEDECELPGARAAWEGAALAVVEAHAAQQRGAMALDEPMPGEVWSIHTERGPRECHVIGPDGDHYEVRVPGRNPVEYSAPRSHFFRRLESAK